MKDLPWQCPDHPDAEIKHTWDENQYVMGGYPVGIASKVNHQYWCNECGRELAAEQKRLRGS